MTDLKLPVAHAREIPFRIEQRPVYLGDGVLHHEVSFGVVGMTDPVSVVVSSLNYERPMIATRNGNGMLELPSHIS